MSARSNSYEPWWLHDDTGRDSRAAQLALSDLHRIELLESHRRSMDRAFVRWYGDSRYNGFSTTGPCYPSPDDYDEYSSNENVIREIITTLYNKFAKNKPQPTVITSGGTYREQAEAEEREKWVRGVFQADDVYGLLSQAQFNSMVFCDGFVGVRDDYELGRPVAFQIAPYEIHLDPPEGCYGKPRTIYWVGSENKDVLAARYPEFAEQIKDATLFFEELWNIRQWNSDTRQINFFEAWHLPSKPGADDGRHIIGIQTATLLNESWPFDYFPLVKVPWNPRPFGYFSAGLIEDLLGPQRQMNRVRNAIDEHLRMLSGSFWAVPRGANVIKSALSNLIGRVVEFTGNAPTLITPQPVSPDLVNHQGTLRSQAFAQARLSQLSAQGVKPAGLNSGKALRVYADQEESGFANAYMAKERAVCDLATLYAKRAQAMLESDRDASLTVRLAKDSQLHEIEWSDSDVDSFRFQTLPTSSLSTTLAGRIEDVEDLENLGLIHDEDEKRQLLQFPDLEASNSLALAPRRLILRTLQTRILEHGESVIPEPYWPLDECTDLGLKVLCFAQLREYPLDKIQLLQNWVNECVARQQPGPTPAPSASDQTQAGMAPGGPSADGQMSAPPLPAGPIPGAP